MPEDTPMAQPRAGRDGGGEALLPTIRAGVVASHLDSLLVLLGVRVDFLHFLFPSCYFI